MKKILIILVVICIIAGLLYLKISIQKKKDKNKDVQMVEVVRKRLITNVLATGELQPRLKIQITAPKRGQVDEIMVDEGDKVEKGQKLAWLSSDDRIALIDAAGINLDKAKDSGDKDKIEQAQKEWDVAQEAYQKIPFLSPIDGEVTLRAVEPGQSVNANAVILGISDRLVIKCQVDETDIGKIRVGMPGRITLDAYPDERLFGKVTKIAHESVVTSNVTTYEVVVELTKSSKVIKSGMTANVEFIVADIKDALVLPINAVMQVSGKSYVFIPSGGTDPEPKEIKTGQENGREIEIVSGLNEGDKVIIKKSKKDELNAGGKQQQQQQSRSILFPQMQRGVGGGRGR